MARQAPDRFTGQSLTTAVKLDVASLPYLTSMYPSSRSAAVRRCIVDRYHVERILRAPGMTDAERVAALAALILGTQQPTTNQETTADGTPTA